MEPTEPDAPSTPDPLEGEPAIFDPDADEPATTQHAQIRLIVEEFGLDRVDFGPEEWRRTGIEYIFRRDVILVEAQHAPFARRMLASAGMLRGDDHPPLPDDTPMDGGHEYGYVTIHVAPGRIFDAIRLIRDGAPGNPGRGDVVTVEHMIHNTGNGAVCPADEPEPVPKHTPPDPPVSPHSADGAGVRVVVVDTGLDDTAPGRSPWLVDVRGDPDPLVQGPLLREYAGHGTFAAGMVRAAAPAAEVWVTAAFSRVGACFERVLVRALDRVLFEQNPDVITMSAGTWAESARGPRLLNEFFDTRFSRHKGVVLVAAAGNDSSRKEFWPAAAPWAVGVGALGPSWRTRARFSNFGGWVDVYAPGDHVVNAFPVGRYRYNEIKRRGKEVVFTGMAVWSGTSFSTPLVAGLIAARMSRTGENGRLAAESVLRQAREATLPGVGPVLLPPTST